MKDKVFSVLTFVASFQIVGLALSNKISCGWLQKQSKFKGLLRKLFNCALTLDKAQKKFKERRLKKLGKETKRELEED